MALKLARVVLEGAAVTIGAVGVGILVSIAVYDWEEETVTNLRESVA